MSEADWDAIGTLYDAALGQRAWHAVGHRMMRAIGGQTLILMSHQPLFQLTEVIDTQGLPEESLRTYAEHYAPQDVWIRAMQEKRLLDRAVAGAELIEDQAFAETEFYVDFLRPRVSLFHISCALLTLGEGRRAVLGIHRPRARGPFDRVEVAKMDVLLRHLRSALFLRQRMQAVDAMAGSALSALDSLALGVVLLKRDGSIVHANAAAAAVLRAADGLVVRDGKIRAADRVDDRRFRSLAIGACQALDSASRESSAGGRTAIHRPSGQPPYAVAITPAGSGALAMGTHAAAAIVFIRDAAAEPALDAKALQAQFGLTPVAARLVRALVSGHSLPKYAAAEGISHNTARKQLARVFEQTNTSSQVELVRLIHSADLGLRRRRT